MYADAGSAAVNDRRVIRMNRNGRRIEKRIRNNRIRRSRELRRNILKVFLSVGIILFLSFSAGGFLSIAKSESIDASCKYYKSILIKPGDSLWSIAVQNMGSEYKDADSYMQEVTEMNHLKDEKITAGNYLIIPYYAVMVPEA